MKRFLGFCLTFIGALLILISILALVKTFDVFTSSGVSSENVVYTMGSIIFPLLLTVFGRWIFRKGSAFRKST